MAARWLGALRSIPSRFSAFALITAFTIGLGATYPTSASAMKIQTVKSQGGIEPWLYE